MVQKLVDLLIYVISNLFNDVVEKLTKCVRQVTGGDVIG